MQSVLIDDDKLTRVLIEEFINQNEHTQLIEQFENAIDAVKFINQHPVDLIFLDIHLPDFSGFDFIQTLANPPKIILITSDKNQAIAAFEYQTVIDYLTKPISKDRFNKAIEKARSLSGANPSEPQPLNELYVNIDRRLVKIDIQQIQFIEASGDYIHIHTPSKKHTVHSTLKKIEEKLPMDVFLKVHRSYVINTKCIVDIEDNSVLIDKSVIPVSRANRPELMKRLNLL